MQEKLHLLQSEAHYKGFRQRQHGSRLHKPTCGPGLHYISVYVQMEKVKKQSQDQKPSQKEIRKELQSIPKIIHIPSGQRPSD